MKDRAYPLHRLAYLSKNGPDSIPKGWELDHICHRRECCNRKHLRLIWSTDHRRITALRRYEDRNENAWAFWKYYQLDNNQLAERYGVKPHTAAGWIKRWKAEEALEAA